MKGKREQEEAMNADMELRKQMIDLLNGGNAHMGFADAVADFPVDRINTFPPKVPYSPWHLLEHIRIAQWDILEFVRDPGHVSPEWPVGYWPDSSETTDAAGWDKTIEAIQADLEVMKGIVMDPETDLTAELPHAPGYNVLREALLVADHNAHHLGEFAILRQVMGTWKH
jgi:hypothetical protein